MFSCVILSIGWFVLCNWQMSDHWHCICTGWTQPLSALAPCHDSRRGGWGSWHHISAALAVSGLYPTVKEGMVRLARLNTLSQWAVRNGRGNENRPQVCCPLPRLHGEPPESPFLVHILLPLLLGGSHVFKVEVIPFILKLIFTSFKKELLKRSSQAQCRIQIRFPLN